MSGPGPAPAATADTAAPPMPGPEHVVRFVAIGDAGEGNDAQFAVGRAVGEVCAELGCDFALYLGDNFYDSGVDSVDDLQFLTKFEDPYAHLDFPFYVVLGNHDLGLEGVGLEFWKADLYVEYAERSDKWTMPAPYYDFDVEHVGFFGLNTTNIFFGFGNDQQVWLNEEIAAPPETRRWTIGFGHHPYISNGQHGNAGEYEGIPDSIPLTEIPRGQHIEELFDASVCGRFDLYLAGHDHNRQWLEPVCGTRFAVSGAGAKTTPFRGSFRNPSLFQDDQEEGFLWLEIADDLATARFFDRDANEDFSTSFTR